MRLELTKLEALMLIACCHCRRDQLMRQLEELFARYGERPTEDFPISEFTAVDGERVAVELMVDRLWTIARSSS